VFSEGFELYIEGKWEEARKVLERVEDVKKAPDGPTNSLLEVLKEHKYHAPTDWQGFRQLTEK
jgi:hypothetical protein